MSYLATVCHSFSLEHDPWLSVDHSIHSLDSIKFDDQFYTIRYDTWSGKLIQPIPSDKRLARLLAACTTVVAFFREFLAVALMLQCCVSLSLSLCLSSVTYVAYCA